MLFFSYLVGTEEGQIHRCSCSYNEQYLDSYHGHTGPVNRISWSPFSQEVFLSCSGDWTMRLWHQDKTAPVLNGDEYVAIVGGTFIALGVDFLFNLPMELKNGKGKAKIDASSLFSLIPAGTLRSSQQTTVDGGVQRLHTAVHDLWKPGLVGDFDNVNTGFAECAAGAAGGENFYAEFGQPGGKRNQAMLVGHTQERPSHR